MDTVLIVEDDSMIRHMLKKGLENDSFIVLEAANGTRSVEIVKRHNVDIILLDIMLPDGNGLDFISPIRSHTDVPVIIVSGRHDKDVKVNGFNLGADDYVEKPFEIEELSARIRANIRRYRGENGHIANENNAVLEFNDWVLDRDKFQIFDKNSNSGNLTAKEFQLLDFLAINAGKVLRRTELCEALSEDNYIPSPRTIDIKIARIRKKIGDQADDPRIIKTVHGVGYIFHIYKEQP